MNIVRAAALVALLLLAIFILRLRSASASSRHTQPITIRQVDSRAEVCRLTLQTIQQKRGLLRSYDADQNFGTVMVDSGYRTSSPQDKDQINGLIRCVLTHGTGDDSVNLIEYVDYSSHKAVAYWSPYEGLEVK